MALTVTIMAVGRLKSGPEEELVRRYADRFARSGSALGLTFGGIVEVPEARHDTAAARKRDEADRLSTALPKDCALIALEERGRTLASPDFAAELARRRDEGLQNLAFLIGGPDGLDPALSKRSEFPLSFGRATWPHQIVRILLTEQLYRAATILTGHPYHRA